MFLFAIAGVALGHYLVDRRAPDVPHHGTTATDDDRADTDVFAAVSQPTGTEATETMPTAERREQ